MRRHPYADRRGHHRRPEPLGDLLAQAFGVHGVHVEWQVAAVLLHGSARDDDVASSLGECRLDLCGRHGLEQHVSSGSSLVGIDTPDSRTSPRGRRPRSRRRRRGAARRCRWWTGLRGRPGRSPLRHRSGTSFERSGVRNASSDTRSAITAVGRAARRPRDGDGAGARAQRHSPRSVTGYDRCGSTPRTRSRLTRARAPRWDVGAAVRASCRAVCAAPLPRALDGRHGPCG